MKKTSVEPLFKLETFGRNSHAVRFDVKSGFEWEMLVRSDAHHDNVHTDQAFEKRHLEEAVAKGAGILDVGDTFCAMQGKYDKRSDLNALRPEHKCAEYLDALVSTAAEFYRPYARNWLVMGLGNHETSIIERHGTNLIDQLTGRLRETPGSVVRMGGYGGWLRLLFTVDKTVRTSVRIKYFHGGGGGAIMSFGTLDIRRMGSYMPDADVVVMGHTHDATIVPVRRERCMDSGRIEQDNCYFIRTPTYKDEYADGSGGWHVERRGQPKPIGACWINFKVRRNVVEITPRLALK